MEYMPNLSLHSHLHGHHSFKCLLDRNRRMNIAIGYAEGIVSTNLIFRMSFFHYHCFTFRYLHHQATPHIIHRDIKANNVYLDSDFQARIGGFRFAKLIPDGAIHVSTEVKGTLSYLAPEYAMLELASGRRPVEKLSSTVKQAMVDLALPLVCEKKFSALAYPRLNGNYVEEELKRVVFVALICAQVLSTWEETNHA
ncbi:hypothetical protein JHK82_017388 [Glycine max]|nr:hypothetical protein JHK82_017388 [Glycine max]